MSFLLTIVSVFLTNCFIGFVVDLLPFKSKKILKIIFASIVDAFILVGNIYYIVAGILFGYEEILSLVIESVFNIVGTITAYVLFLLKFKDETKIHSSRREKLFIKASKGKDTRFFTRKNSLIVVSILMGLFAVMLITTIIIPKTDKSLSNIITYSILLAVTIILGGCIYSTKMISHNALLIIRTRNADYIYLKTLKSGEKIGKYLEKISEFYIINDYGFIITPSEKYQAYGFDIDEVLEEALESITFDKFNAEKISKAFALLDSKHKKEIILDIDGNVTSEKSIK